MEQHDLVELMDKGTVAFCDRDDAASDIRWNPHPKFKGVSLKHLITGKDTNGKLSCHMVRVEPGCELESHVHADQWELHEVIRGSGMAVLDGKTMEYASGKAAVIPTGKTHSVRAMDDGLVLLAKFFPALV